MELFRLCQFKGFLYTRPLWTWSRKTLLMISFMFFSYLSWMLSADITINFRIVNFSRIVRTCIHIAYIRLVNINVLAELLWPRQSKYNVCTEYGQIHICSLYIHAIMVNSANDAATHLQKPTKWKSRIRPVDKTPCNVCWK